MSRFRFYPAMVLVIATVTGARAEPPRVDFESAVARVFVKNCIECHNPTEASAAGQQKPAQGQQQPSPRS